MSALPVAWTLRSLGELADPVPVRSQSKPAPVLTFRGLRANGQLDLGLPESGRFASALDGDVVLTKQGHVAGWVLKKVGRVRSKTPIYVASTLQLIRPRDPGTSGWLYHWLSASGTYDLVQDMLGARNSLTAAVLSAIPVPVPLLEEQSRIVALLEDHLSRLDAVDRWITDASLRQRSLVVSALRREFCLFGAPLHRPLQEVATIINGQTPRGIAGRLRPTPAADTLPYWKVGDMNESDGTLMIVSRFYVPRSDAEQLHLRVAPAGTVVFPKRGGSIATNKKRVLGVDGCFDLNTMGVSPGDFLHPAFLLRWFQQVDLRRLADGSNVPQINMPDITGLSIPVPTVTRQKELVDQVERLDDAQLRLPVTALSAKSVALRRSLFHAALSGALIGSGTLLPHGA